MPVKFRFPNLSHENSICRKVGAWWMFQNFSFSLEGKLVVPRKAAPCRFKLKTFQMLTQLPTLSDLVSGCLNILDLLKVSTLDTNQI